MKIPHSLFKLINWVMVAILRSPLHGVFSSSILAIRYTGVRSGRVLTVPARYQRRGDSLQLVTSLDTAWWPNFVDGLDAQVLVAGIWHGARVEALRNAPEVAGPLLRQMWQAHPSDAAYMEVKMVRGEPDPEDFARAVAEAVVIRVTLAP